MKKIYASIALIICMSLAAVSCAEKEEMPAAIEEGAVVYPTLNIGVSEMSLSASSRALAPMSPDLEKYVRTIAIFEFDKEGVHQKKKGLTYHFIDFKNGTVNGETGVGDVEETEFGIVETTLRGLAFESHLSGTLCLVANIKEDLVDAFYNAEYAAEQSYGRVMYDKFKQWAIPFVYLTTTATRYDESVMGHLESMFMFGYYQGPINSDIAGTLRIDLGRMASRIDITVVNETGQDITKRLSYHFDNVCHSAYFFPILSSMPATAGTGLSRTVICQGNKNLGDRDELIDVPWHFAANSSHTRYFYVAAHSAADINDATFIHLFYNQPVGDCKGNGHYVTTGSNVMIPLCNVHPSEAATVKNGYSLSRNTRYHFTIRLKKKTDLQSNSSEAPSRSVDYGPTPGDITVYLP